MPPPVAETAVAPAPSGPDAYRFIRFGPGVDEIWQGDLRVFVLAPPAESPLLLTGRCPHRGGPLALGEFNCHDKTLRCPWHGQLHSLARLRARALPAIRTGNFWLVAVDEREPAAGLELEPICFRRHHPLPQAAPWESRATGAACNEGQSGT